MLLHLIDGQPAADCVERPWTVVDEIVGMRRAPVDHVDDAAVERGGVEFFAAALAIQADAEFGARLRIENQPALFLAAREARAARGFVVGMDLDRQPFRGEEEFDHDRRFVAGGVGEPNLSDAAAAEVTEIRSEEHTSELPSLMRI